MSSKFPLIFTLFIALVLIISGFFFIAIRYLPAKQIDSNLFSNSTRLVIEKDKDGKEVRRYYVIDINNGSNQDLYNCSYYLIDKGNRDEYLGFTSDLRFEDCKRIGNVQFNFDCRLRNGVKRVIQYPRATTNKKHSKNQNFTLAISRFYIGETDPAKSITRGKTLNDIDLLKITCQERLGRKVNINQAYQVPL